MEKTKLNQERKDFMRKSRKTKFGTQLLSILVALFIVLGMIPNAAFAQGQANDIILSNLIAENNSKEAGNVSTGSAITISSLASDGSIPISSEDDLRKIGRESDYKLDGNYILTGNIILTEPWIPIGKIVGNENSSESFIGTFDGDGYTVSGLTINAGNITYQGLFGKIGAKGTVQNVTVEGVISSTYTSNAFIGGIAGQVQGGKIINCINKVQINAVKAKKVGGIVGDTTLATEIIGCANLGNISATSNVGGIVGSTAGTTKVTNCYNTGEITTDTSSCGGVVGYAYGTTIIQNCYNADTGVRSGSNSGLLIGFLYSSSSALNSYWLGDDNTKGIGNKSAGKIADDCTFKTDEQLKGIVFLDILNVDAPEGSQFVFDDNNINNGYPILECQLPKVAKFEIQFNINPNDASLTVKDEKGTNKIGSNGFYKLPAGNYTYFISAFGYNDKNGYFEVVDDENPSVINISLTEADKQTVSFSGLPKGALISVNHAVGGKMNPGPDGNYKLPTGTYSYSAVAKGYELVKKTFEVVDESVNIAVEMTSLATPQPWDGTTKTSVSPIDGTYYIKSGAELAWFASETIAGRLLDVSVVLLSDINLDSKAWLSISPYSGTQNYFKGILDGNHCTIDNLSGGLFHRTDKDALIKNLTVSGSINGTGNIGGIVGVNYGKIENCRSNVNITASEQRVGGIVGDNSGGIILRCVATGIINSSFRTYAQSDTYRIFLGGIAGQNSGTIEYCYSLANVSATSVAEPNKTNHPGGVGGITGVNTGTVNSCYNIGTVRYNDRKNFNTGSVIGDNSNSNAKIKNSYYLEGTCTNESGEDLGVGIGSKDGVQSKDIESMKASSFVIALNNGNSEGPFNADEDININGGYPVLKWQGGQIPVTTEDETSVLEDKEELELVQTIIKQAGALDLPKNGKKGSNITWSSDNPSVISDNGVVTLPSAGISSVVLTATIKKGAIRDTKSFTITVYSALQVILDELNAAKAGLGTLLRPVNGTDVNIVELADKILKDKKFTGITVTLKSPGNTSIGTDTYIAADGVITYFYKDPSDNSAMNMGIVHNIEFTLSKDGQNIDTNKIQANIPWDRARVLETLENEISSKITWDAIKGKNVSTDEISLALTLPLILPTARWAKISWEADSAVIMPEYQSNPLAENTTGILNRRATDTQVKLTATIKFNLTTSNEDDIVLTKDFDLKVLGSEEADTPERMLKKLENYTLEKLKDSLTKTQLNPNAVKGDIQFPTPANTGVADYSKYRFTVTSKNTDILEINGYRGLVYRPLPGNSSEKVGFTITMTSRADSSLSVSKDMEITVIPLEQKEIDDALKLMEAVKMNYTAALLGENADKDNITKNLKTFRQAIFAEDGNSLIYSRAINEDKDYGILVDDLPGSEPGGPGYEQWRVFRSSRPNILEHEVLRLKQPEYNTNVKVDSCLTHKILGKYANKHPENEDFKKLYKQPISATFTVIGEKGDNGTEVKEISVGTAIIVFKEDGTYEKKSAPKDIKINIDNNDGGFTAYGALQATTSEYAGSPNWITSIYGITGPLTGGWMFAVNGKVPNTTAGQTILKEGDQVIWYCTYDYNRDKAPTWKELGGKESENYKITINLSKTFLKVGEELPLVAQVQKGDEVVTDKEVMWLGSNAKASIENGKLIAKEAGEITLIASLVDDKNVKDTITISIEENKTLTTKQIIEALRKHYINKSDYTFRQAIGYNFTSDNLENDLLEIAYRFKTNENPKTASDHVGNIMGLIAAGKNPYAYNNKNYVKALADAQGSNGKFVIGAYDDYPTVVAFSILALDMAKAEYNRDKAIEALLGYQDLTSGSFGGADETGMVLTALAKYKNRADVQSSIDKGLSYLQTTQDINTGGIIAWGEENPYSASAVLQGLIAVGENPLSQKWTKNGKTIVDSLMKYYKDGHFENAAGIDEMLTEQAFIALSDVYRGKSMFNEIKLNDNEVARIAIQIPNIPKIIEGDFIKLFVTGYAANNDIAPVGKIIWSSSDTNVATVDENGNVIAMKAGESTITAKVDGKDIIDTVKLTISAKEFNTEYIGDDIVSNGNTFEANLKVKNLTEEKKKVALIVALYDKNTNKMLSFKIKELELSSKEEQDLLTEIQIPANGKYYIRIFLWDSLENQDVLLKKFEEFKAS